ncbi:MAG: carboxypeptidase regulatory-like domain-containing protein [Chloracidobacterium sp.]|nr:carboxypeptidase regulatory-like domain-containing protein [Chloracidobacterium sp.]
MKRAIAIVFIGLLIKASTAGAQTNGAITGRVVADDGAGMAGVTVMLSAVVAIRGGLSRSTTTDEEGNFRFTDLSPRPYSVSAFGSREYVQPQATTGSGERRYYRPGENVHITLIRGGVITGRVTNAAGEPVIGIQVLAIRVRDADGRTARIQGGSSQRLTDDRGVYRIYGLQPGGYIVVANSNSNYSGGSAYYGETPTYHPSSTRDAAAEVTVASGTEASGVDIRYRGEPGHAVSGRMTGVNPGESFAPCMVYLTHAATGASFDLMYANPSQGGAFAFYGVPDGEYDLTAERLESDRNDPLGSEPRRVTIRGADVTGVELRLSPRATVEGKVVLDHLPQRCEEKSQPGLEEIILRARRDDAVKAPLPAALSIPRDTAANEKGEFLLKSLYPARYRLQVSLPDDGWYLKSITGPASATAGGGASASGADIARGGILLRAGERLGGVMMTIAEGAANLRGRVTPGKEGARLSAKLAVHLVPAETASANDVLRYAETVVEREGAFEFRNIAPGRYRLLARPMPDDDPSDSPSLPAAWDANGRAKLRKEAEAIKIEIDLKPCQRVSDQIVKYR